MVQYRWTGGEWLWDPGSITRTTAVMLMESAHHVQHISTNWPPAWLGQLESLVCCGKKGRRPENQAHSAAVSDAARKLWMMGRAPRALAVWICR